MKACVVAETNERAVPALTLGDALRAAADVSETEAPIILQALFASGRIRFRSPDAQREVDALSRLFGSARPVRRFPAARRTLESPPRSAGAA
jgi:hypothetical protein